MENPPSYFGIMNSKKMKEGGPRTNISILAYVFNSQLNIVGVGLKIDRFFYDGIRLDLGYSGTFKIGVDFNGYGRSDLSVSAIALFGKTYNKLELNLGPNLPLGYFAEKNKYNYVNLGIGYRHDGLFHFRLGVATTSLLYVGFGIIV